MGLSSLKKKTEKGKAQRDLIKSAQPQGLSKIEKRMKVVAGLSDKEFERKKANPSREK